MKLIFFLHNIQEKQFKCGECEKSFKRNSELIRHQSCHSDARPYVCSLCGQAYKRTNHLRRHEKNVHELIVKNKKVQRLKTDSTGAVIPIPSEPKNPIKDKKIMKKTEVSEPIYSLTNEQIGEYYSSTVSVINSVSLPKTISNNLIPMDADTFNQQELWESKLDLPLEKTNGILYNTNPTTNVTQMSLLNSHENDLLTINVMDQLVKSLLPSKDLQMIDCQEFNDYTTNIPLDYNNVASPALSRENSVLTTNQKIGVNDISW